MRKIKLRTDIMVVPGSFLPMQIIFEGKTGCNLSRGVSFPEGFHVTQNEKHWSNEVETIKFIQHINNPKVVATRKELGLPESQKALLIWDVFKGQCSAAVNALLDKLNMKVVTVPANITHFFHPLDLTLSGSVRHFMQKRFIT